MQIDLSLAIAIFGVLLSIGSIVYARLQANAARAQAESAISSITAVDTMRISALWREIMENDTIREAYLAENPRVRPLWEKYGFKTVLLVREYFNNLHGGWHLRSLNLVRDYRWVNLEQQTKAFGRSKAVREMFETWDSLGVFDPRFSKAWRGAVDRNEPFDPRRT